MTVLDEYEQTIMDIINLKDQVGRSQASQTIERMLLAMAKYEDYAWATFLDKAKLKIDGQEGGFRIEAPKEGITLRPDLAARAITKQIRTHASEPYFVTAGMTHKLMEWIEEHDLYRTISRHMLPTDSGYIRFQGGLTVADWEGDTVNMDAMVWGPHPMNPGHLCTYWFTDLDNPLSVRLLGKNGAPSTGTPGPNDSPEALEEFRNQLKKSAAGNMLLDTYSFMTFDSKIPLADQDKKTANYITCALFMMMSQPIARVTGVPTDTRFVRKAAKRKGINDELNVIYLRREVDRNPELRDKIRGLGPQRRRHYVRSHWAHYWVKTEDGEKVRVLRKRREHFRGSGETVMKDPFFRMSR